MPDMNKRLLIRNIRGETIESEREEVNEWIGKSEDNRSYYINLLNLFASQELSREGLQYFTKEEIKEKLSQIYSNTNKKRVTKFYIITTVAASLLLMLSVLLNIYQFNNKEVATDLIAMSHPPKSKVINTFYTERGVKGKIVLEDSTVVWLNSDSRIVYPEHFSVKSREIMFEGEGFFHVKENSDWPMIVTTSKGMKIKVLGTKFHVKSYNNDDSEQATLFSGKIELEKEIMVRGGKSEQRTIEMIPNETVIFDKDFVRSGQEVISHNADTTKKIAWRRGELLFEETPMNEVIKMLERWHGAKIVVTDNSLMKHQYTGSFNSESLVQILELIKFTSPVDYIIENNIVYLKKRRI